MQMVSRDFEPRNSLRKRCRSSFRHPFPSSCSFRQRILMLYRRQGLLRFVLLRAPLGLRGLAGMRWT